MSEKTECFRLIVEGDVQGVAYRAYVKRVANSQEIKGIVRNLKNGTVEIFCKCTPKKLDEFKELIKKKRKDKTDIYIPNVKNIRVYSKEEEQYSKNTTPPIIFEQFKIDYGMDLNTYEKETMNRDEIASLFLLDTRRETTCVGQKVEKMGNNVIDCFNTMEKKYGSFSKDMKEIKDCFKQLLVVIEKYVDEKSKST